MMITVKNLARKEIRQHVAPLKKSVTALRKTVSELRREIATLKQTVKLLEDQEARRLDTPPTTTKDATIRFSPRWVVADRKRLGLSANHYGRLIGVSGQTIYSWESTKSKPRAERLASWAAVRGIGKREARRCLALLKRSDQATSQ